MFHPNTDVKANLKLLTVTELRSILQARAQTFVKANLKLLTVTELRSILQARAQTFVKRRWGGGRIYMFYLIMFHCFPYYLKQ